MRHAAPTRPAFGGLLKKALAFRENPGQYEPRHTTKISRGTRVKTTPSNEEGAPV